MAKGEVSGTALFDLNWTELRPLTLSLWTQRIAVDKWMKMQQTFYTYNRVWLQALALIIITESLKRELNASKHIKHIITWPLINISLLCLKVKDYFQPNVHSVNSLAVWQSTCIAAFYIAGHYFYRDIIDSETELCNINTPGTSDVSRDSASQAAQKKSKWQSNWFPRILNIEGAMILRTSNK